VSLVGINRNPSRRELRQFGCLFLPAFLAFLAWGAVSRSGTWEVAAWLIGVALLSIAVGLWRPVALRPLFVGWLFVVYPIGWVVSHTILAILYYVVLTPVGLLMRLAGRDPMDRAIDPKASTFWVRHNPGAERARYFRQF
jgi:hypothetical protein